MVENIIRRRETRKNYYQKNREKIRIYQKDWRMKNKDKISTYEKEYYQKHKIKLNAARKIYSHTPKGIEVRNRAAQKQSLKRWQWMRNFKMDKKCIRCGQSFPDHPNVLDFHHIDSKTHNQKDEAPSRLFWSQKRFLKEIKNCEIVCANCHRIIHDEMKLNE
jgi:predicted HNH restriction endonuclease